VTEPTGDGADIDARSNGLGGGEVAQIVEPDIWCADLVPDPDEEARHVVGTEGDEGIDDRRKDERIRGKRLPARFLRPSELKRLANSIGAADGPRSWIPTSDRRPELQGRRTLPPPRWPGGCSTSVSTCPGRSSKVSVHSSTAPRRSSCAETAGLVPVRQPGIALPRPPDDLRVMSSSREPLRRRLGRCCAPWE